MSVIPQEEKRVILFSPTVNSNEVPENEILEELFSSNKNLEVSSSKTKSFVPESKPVIINKSKAVVKEKKVSKEKEKNKINKIESTITSIDELLDQDIF